MLEDLSQHVLDITENSVAADATSVLIEITESTSDNVLSMIVQDNGKGMSPEFLAKVTDPFTTSRTTRRVGMGLPFLKQSTELCGGRFVIKSEVGVGTRTEAYFQYDCIDRPPIGNMPETVMSVFMGHPEIDWTYKHTINGREFCITTMEIIEVLEDRELLRTTEVGLWLRDQVAEALDQLRNTET